MLRLVRLMALFAATTAAGCGSSGTTPADKPEPKDKGQPTEPAPKKDQKTAGWGS